MSMCLSFHDYSQTRAQIEADIKRGQALSARLKKPIINTEMACVGRANPYDIEIEEHNKAHMGWIFWELMIAHSWGNVHGIMYADGTIRDPAIVAAILGFYRNRGPNVVMEETDREGITSGVLDDARKWLANPKPDYFDGMVIAETEANTLEAAELVGHARPADAQGGFVAGRAAGFRGAAASGPEILRRAGAQCDSGHDADAPLLYAGGAALNGN